MSGSRAAEFVLHKAATGMLLLSATALLGACADTGRRPLSADYSCENGDQFTVLFGTAEAQLIRGSDPAIRMPRRPAASGFAFGTPMHSISGRGRELTLMTGRAAPVRCRELRRGPR